MALPFMLVCCYAPEMVKNSLARLEETFTLVDGNYQTCTSNKQPPHAIRVNLLITGKHKNVSSLCEQNGKCEI